MNSLTVVPLTLKTANEHVAKLHRHHKPSVGHKFSIGVKDYEGILRGVAIMGRPVARMRDDGLTLEVARLCTDGYPNACSCLYGAARRIAKEMGYRRLGTYILESEPGVTLKAAGWKEVGRTSGGTWSRPSRGRVDAAPTCPKVLWEAVL